MTTFSRLPPLPSHRCQLITTRPRPQLVMDNPYNTWYRNNTLHNAMSIQESQQMMIVVSPLRPDCQTSAARIEVQHDYDRQCCMSRLIHHISGLPENWCMNFWPLRRSQTCRDYNYLHGGTCAYLAAAACRYPCRLCAGAAPECHHGGALCAQRWGPSSGRLPSPSIPAGLQILAAASLLSAASSKFPASFQ